MTHSGVEAFFKESESVKGTMLSLLLKLEDAKSFVVTFSIP